MKKICWTSALTAFVFMTLLSPMVFAGSAVLYLAPASGNIAPGSVVSFQIKENSGTEPVNAIQANLSYPKNSLDYVGTDDSSAFTVVAQTENKNGTLLIARGALPPFVTGAQNVATVKFKVKKTSGNVNIQFLSGSAVALADGKGTNILSGTTGGTYAIKAASAPTTTAVNTSSTSAPAAPTVDSVTVAGQTTSTNTTQPLTTSKNKPIVLKGVTIPNGIVYLYVYSTPKKYTTVADKDGNWSYIVANLEPGQHKVEVEVVDPITHKTSPRQKIIDFTVLPLNATQISYKPAKTVSANLLYAGVPIAFAAGALVYLYIDTRRGKRTTQPTTANYSD